VEFRPLRLPSKGRSLNSARHVEFELAEPAAAAGVETIRGPVLILAGRARQDARHYLPHCHLIERGILPGNILGHFTNKAAREMQGRWQAAPARKRPRIKDRGPPTRPPAQPSALSTPCAFASCASISRSWLQTQFCHLRRVGTTGAVRRSWRKSRPKARKRTRRQFSAC